MLPLPKRRNLANPYRLSQERREPSAAATGRRTPKTFPGLELELNKLCSTLARRPADSWAPANDGKSLTARALRGFNSAGLGGASAAGPKPARSTDLASATATITENSSGALTPELSGRVQRPRSWHFIRHGPLEREVSFSRHDCFPG